MKSVSVSLNALMPKKKQYNMLSALEGSSLENYTSNNTPQHQATRHNTRQHKYNATQHKCNKRQYEYNTTQHECNTTEHECNTTQDGYKTT